MTESSSTAVQPEEYISARRPRFSLFFRSYGVDIEVRANSDEAIDAIRSMLPEVLPGQYEITPETQVKHRFDVRWNKSGRDSAYRNGEAICLRSTRQMMLETLGSRIRVTVAEFALDHVFVHSGCVCWKGKAIIFPAASFRGKSALTAELVRRGAVYYSDEYAVLDRDGFVHPFAKKLSIRGEIGKYTQVEHPVEDFGGVAGTERAEIALVLLTKYKEYARWRPKALSPAEAIMGIMEHTIPIRHDPRFALRVLSKVAAGAVTIRTNRGEAAKFADTIIEYFESTIK
ncbi:MAG: hypothetical protein WBD22_00055 [Pyrinomonadaceae bacterium]